MKVLEITWSLNKSRPGLFLDQVCLAKKYCRRGSREDVCLQCQKFIYLACKRGSSLTLFPSFRTHCWFVVILSFKNVLSHREWFLIRKIGCKHCKYMNKYTLVIQSFPPLHDGTKIKIFQSNLPILSLSCYNYTSTSLELKTAFFSYLPVCFNI